MSRRFRDRIITVALFAGVVTWLLATEGREGFGRDEGQYMRAGERYWGWFEELGRNLRQGRAGQSFAAANIDHYWSDNAPDHPVVMKTLYGLSWRAFHRCNCMGPARALHPVPVLGRHITLPLFKRESTAFRFPAILMSGLLAALVFRFARKLVPWPAAAAGAVLAIAQPHYFFHAPIACFDAPITTMAFAVGFAYWKSLRSARWGLWCGVIFGIALGVKHNAWLMPAFLVAHYLWMRRGDLRRLRPPRLPLAFLSMAVVGPLVFFAHWPWLWHHPVQRTRTYLNRHLQHEHYNFEYLGRNWNLPPTDLDLKLLRATFPFVSTGLTVPVTTLGLAVLGGLVLARRRRGRPLADDAQPPSDAVGLSRPLLVSRASPATGVATLARRPSWMRPGLDVDRAPGAFVAAQLFGPLAVLAIPSTPIFGGVKHFLPAMPYLAVAAACGLAWVAAGVADVLRARGAQRHVVPATVLLSALVCVPAVTETQRSHPDGLSHYNMVAGGFTGGATLGMNRQFWAYCVLPMLDWVNHHAPDNQRMYWHDVLGDALAMYKREGRLDMSVGDTGFGEPGVERSAMGLLVHEKHWALYEKFLWDHYGTLKPSLVREREGVPLVIGYERPRP
ncbi:MAG: glycosyltransferase family 39 protein [Myxococcales bacterium]